MNRSPLAEFKPVLVLLTSHRTDCLALTLRCLERFTDLSAFERIHLVCNAVEPPLAAVAETFAARHENVRVRHCAPRGLVPAVMREMNAIISEHPGSPVVKMDEDVFVSPGWDEAFAREWARHLDDSETLLVGALTPVGSAAHRLMDRFMEQTYPRLHKRYAAAGDDVAGNRYYHRSMWEAVLGAGVDRDLVSAWRDFSEREPAVYSKSIPIHLVMYDQRLLQHVYPFPEEMMNGMAMVDELSTNLALAAHGRACIITDPLAHHYSHWRSELYLRKFVSVERVADWFAEHYSGFGSEPLPDAALAFSRSMEAQIAEKKISDL